jgi:hypothetical protein
MSVVSIMIGACALIGTALPAAATPVSSAANLRGARSAAWPGLTSGNWSGYAQTGGAKYTYASGTWLVPSVQAKQGYSSSWVGIDGFNNNNLIQTGTEQDYVGGHTVYRAWWEILPAAETIIPSLKITPGDKITAFVKNTSGNAWTISISDVTTGKSFSINKNYSGAGKSAEWIQEAPTGGSGVLPLAHYSETEFSGLQIAHSFASPTNATLAFPSKAIAMVQNKQVSTPSKPTANSFNVAYGKKQPTAP